MIILVLGPFASSNLSALTYGKMEVPVLIYSESVNNRGLISPCYNETYLAQPSDLILSGKYA